ncbi:DegT/DnrJ/EryC1/StrS family aminotransferase [Chloroflexota bacterium]
MKVEYSYLLEQFKVEESETKVKYVDLSKQANVEAILSDIKEVLLKTGQFTLGQPVADFESRFAKLCKTKYAIGVNSGTDALILALKALNIGSGDEVITAPNSFIATAGAIAVTGAKPVFVDVDDEYNIDADLIEKSITPQTKAIMPVHLTGNPADMPRIMEIADKHNLHVIEDACQAVSALINGKPAGSFGIAGAFSFHPLKNLNVWGDGGMVTTDSKELYEKLLLLRNHGLKGRDEVEFFAYNSRLDTLQAIVANQLLNVLDAITDARIRNAKRYDDALSDMADYVTIPPRKGNVKQVYHTYVILAKERDRLGSYLAEKGIETKVHYPIPIHLQKASKYLGYKEGDFPVCEVQTKSILTLPVHQHLTDDQVEYVIDNIRKFYKEA